MNHYDGPAFFRKYRFNKPQVNNSAASQSTPVAASASPQSTAGAPSAAPKRPASQTSAKQVTSQATTSSSSAATSATLFNGGTHGTFHPSRVPAQLSAALTNGGIIQDHDDRNYLEIEASLHKRPETFLLFADAAANDLPAVDLQQPLSDSGTDTSQVEHPSDSAVLSQAERKMASSVDSTTVTSQAASSVAAQTVVANTSQTGSDSTVSAASAMVVRPTEVFEPTTPELAVSAAAINTPKTDDSVVVTAPTEVFEPTDPSLAASAAAINAPSAVSSAVSAGPTEVFEPTDPSLAASAAAVNAPSAVSSAVSAGPTEVFEPTDPSLAASAAAINASSAVSLAVSAGPTEVFEPTDPALAESAATVNAAADHDKIESAATSATPKSAHGLGLSLGDIMTAEHDAQADLALFKDQPTTAASAAPQSSTAQTRSHVNEEPYQPVGMRPTSTSPAVTSATATPVSVVASSTVPSQESGEATSVTMAPSQAATSAVTTSPALSETSAVASQPELVHSGGSAAPVLEDKELAAYHLPPLNLLKAPIVANESEMDDWIEQKASALDESLDAFGVNANVVDWTIGPTVTQFQVKPARGVKVSKITNLNDDLKLALAAKDIRIEAPIPGRNTIGIEIPNAKSRPVMLSEVLDSDKFRDSKSPLTVALGVDLFGQPQVTDLRKMPHGLIAGATGSGKSVFINSILVSILYKANPQQVKLLLIDPKAVELAPYNEIPHLLAPVISEPKAASAALKWVVDEMDNRYDKLAAGGARNIEQFNKLADEHDEPALKMPYIVIVIDELADLMMVASSEVQDYIARITQKARAAGIHLLVATQRPSVDVVTGLIKNNIPTRVAFMVASQIDSRTILDASGAERLLGRGDMLYLGNGQPAPIRLQGTFVDSEIDSITQFVRDQAAPHYEFQPDSLMKHEEAARNEDDLMPEALAYIADEDTMSTSKLQRNFSIGYNRAANIIDDLESRGYVSAAKGSKPRDVYFTAADLTKLQANS
ncbi:DNA translocase FtsK [Lactiplantibacillus plantarum]|jgi:DNA segregation ATPase FtsK/SpoIIIE, S-DNA-T family|uniref:DNA translocase FtsK n=1 Tax=Lactiplantibacillus plantarum TaxID=1590 RepID=UPI0007EE43E2|nr:DNA translocase FtsK [Lactiplantibacillus plantarum]TYA18831.1 cell division protein FtsK [Lactobacillus sp. LSI2-1]AXH04113.1 DNA translocase FtsK [Lactiplantibacillus plantarum]MBA2819135.1 DNA translocase SftA [Lactiplantibacillus plantarum]MBH5331589.1 cell division protein FtsK [Lactiplantibacillus plantarum]MCB7466729.1 cell division protein FtsK [Lactiplantibacillus plantarum]